MSFNMLANSPKPFYFNKISKLQELEKKNIESKFFTFFEKILLNNE